MIAPASLDLDTGLRRLGFESFRPGQREAIETLLEAGRLLLVAPTGGGKSLAYQLPAALLPGTTIVISPLIALMQDQVQALEARGVPATYLASTLDPDEHQRRLRQLADGEFRLAFVAPERLAFDGFRALASRLECPLVAIDEAHCISEWGHDFRPEYRQIGAFLAELPHARVLACTATATPVVRDEILQQLAFPPGTPQHVRGFARPNLALRAREVSTGRERERHVDALLAEALGEPGRARGAAIVYSPTRRMSEQEADRLAARGWNATCYHAGLDGRTRDSRQRAFREGALEVVVATNAFGMGIDRADVRAVVHLAPPGSIEAYYQEVGRAGRDGEPAWGLVLTSPQDLPRRRRLIELPTDGREVDPAVVEHKWNQFLDLLRWIESGTCRHDAILEYFDSPERAAARGCGRCDVCVGLASDDRDEETVAVILRKALSGVARAHDRFGLTTVAKLLKGARDERLARAGLDQLSTHGVLADHDERWIVRLLRRLVTAGWATLTGGDRPLMRLTPAGSAVMRGDAPATVLLPPESVAPPGFLSKSAQVGRRAPAPEELDADAHAIFERLRAHRIETAQKEGVPPYRVASDRTLRELAQHRPASPEAMLLLYGIGPAKVERYGCAWLALVSEGR